MLHRFALRLVALPLCIGLSACGKTQTVMSPLASTGDIVTLDVTAERKPMVINLLQKLAAAHDHGGAIKLEDILAIVPIGAAGRDKFATAYPDALTVSCDGGFCSASGSGASARAPTVTDNPDLQNVDIGVRPDLAASFVVKGESEATICGIEGVYFAKLLFRKNLKAAAVNADVIKVWLAGADDIPDCAAP